MLTLEMTTYAMVLCIRGEKRQEARHAKEMAKLDPFQTRERETNVDAALFEASFLGAA